MTWLDDARNVTLETAATGLGIAVSRHGALCPICGHEDACKAQAGERWWCFSGQHGGDVVDLVSAVLVGEPYKRQHIGTVRGWFAGQGWCDSYGDAAPVVPRRAPPQERSPCCAGGAASRAGVIFDTCPCVHAATTACTCSQLPSVPSLHPWQVHMCECARHLR